MVLSHLALSVLRLDTTRLSLLLCAAAPGFSIALLQLSCLSPHLLTHSNAPRLPRSRTQNIFRPYFGGVSFVLPGALPRIHIYSILVCWLASLNVVVIYVQ